MKYSEHEAGSEQGYIPGIPLQPGGRIILGAQDMRW
jgi:hypothetical protein